MKTRHLKWVPVVMASGCTGCQKCVESCGPGSLEVREGVATLVWVDTCGSEGHCIPVCPEGVIRMEWRELDGDRKRGKWSYGGRVWPTRLRGS